MTKKAINCVWSYDADTRVSTCVHPDGHIISYDMNEITDPKVIDFIFYYGHKQFIQDKSAGIGAGATGEDKSAVWTERHEMLVNGAIYKTGGVRAKTVPQPTFAQFYEKGKEFGMTEEQAKVMYGQLYPVPSK